MKCLNCRCKFKKEKDDKYSDDDDKYAHHLHCCSKKCVDSLGSDKKKELYMSSILDYYYELKGK